MNELVLSILIFMGMGVGFLATNLLVGRLLRPNNPSAVKGSTYECGEETIGETWVQFDLRFYVVALLFVIFDVELAFFFPWATVFGTANRLSQPDTPADVRLEITRQLDPAATIAPPPEAMAALARFAFVEFAIFFAILIVGFAYLWKRGDLAWVRSTLAQPDSAPGAVRG
jgi:NADH-quinone oxidoreductase subunit A